MPTDDTASAARRVAEAIRADILPDHLSSGALLPILDAVAAGPDADRVERWVFFLLQVFDDASPEWAKRYVARAKVEPHRGDCPLAEHQGPITCDRCVWEDYSAKARAAIALADAEAAARVAEGWAAYEAARDDLEDALEACTAGRAVPGELVTARAALDAAVRRLAGTPDPAPPLAESRPAP